MRAHAWGEHNLGHFTRVLGEMLRLGFGQKCVLEGSPLRKKGTFFGQNCATPNFISSFFFDSLPSGRLNLRFKRNFEQIHQNIDKMLRN